MGHVSALLEIPDTEIAYLAEVDPARLAKGLDAVTKKQASPCKGVGDFRTFLDDKDLDAVFIAMPNFWHTPAALLCLQAGKHVYVEKPGSQNPHEGEMLVAGAKKYNRLVQMGNQRRTVMREAIAALQGGIIGTPHYGRGFYYNARVSIGQGSPTADRGIDMNLWQGPVPDDGHDIRPFVHYNWHWFWHWGNGEIGNNGIHGLDVLRWGLGVEYPLRVTYNGGRYCYKDAQETPDTACAVYDCGNVGFAWEQSSCQPRKGEKPPGTIIFYGDQGLLAATETSYTILDNDGKTVNEVKTKFHGEDIPHMSNFLDAIRGNGTLNSPIEEGQKSTLLCHLGNMAYRTGSMIHFDPATRRIVGNPEADKLWQRTYRPGWEPKV
jgi:predicted dehydrogenase